MKALTFSDLYKNIEQQLKNKKKSQNFTLTQEYLNKNITNPYKIDVVIEKIKSGGAKCDSEILTKIKPRVNGRTILVVIEE